MHAWGRKKVLLTLIGMPIKLHLQLTLLVCGLAKNCTGNLQKFSPTEHVKCPSKTITIKSYSLLKKFTSVGREMPHKMPMHGLTSCLRLRNLHLNKETGHCGPCTVLHGDGATAFLPLTLFAMVQQRPCLAERPLREGWRACTPEERKASCSIRKHRKKCLEFLK